MARPVVNLQGQGIQDITLRTQAMEGHDLAMAVEGIPYMVS